MELLVGLKRFILFCGIAFVVLGFVVILCDAMTNNEDEESLKARQSSTAFWVGLPYLALGALILYMSRVQNSLAVKICKISSAIVFILSLLALVFEGPDWNFYLNYKNYVCGSGSQTSCTTSGNLSSLFGTITVAITVAVLLSISNILICNWLLFRMNVETPEMDFDREDVKRSMSTKSKDDLYKTQGYHACWNERQTSLSEKLSSQKSLSQKSQVSTASDLDNGNKS